MDMLAKAVAEALAKKGIDVQDEYNKASNRLCGVSIRPTNRNHIHKGIKQKDHIIQKPITKKENDD